MTNAESKSIEETIYYQCTETYTDFVFEQVRPYCAHIVSQQISKEHLEKALVQYSKVDLHEWLESFNTESATACFTAIQELKKRIGGDR